MKFIKNGVILEPHNEFVIQQMQKMGYQVYEEPKAEAKEEQPVEPKAEVKEKKKKK